MIPDEYIFQDDGISGKSADNRPNFRLMIATAKQTPPPFTAIFVWKFSRFARNQEEAIMYKNLLKKRGIDVRSVSEPQTDSPFSSLIERIIEWMDEYYVINLAEEVKRGMKEKSLRGEAMGRPPFGYDVKDKTLVKNEDAMIVRRIFEDYAAGASFREISLNYPNLTGQAVRYILSNPAYIGKTRWDDGEHELYRSTTYLADITDMPDGLHEPIVDRELWDAVQRKLAKKQTGPRYRQANKPDYLFKGMVRCSDCGATLCEMSQPGHKRSLQCSKYNRGICKHSHFIQLDTLLSLVIEGLSQAIEDDAYRVEPPQPRQRAAEADEWGKYIAAEETRLKRAKLAYVDGLFSEDDFREVKSSVDANIAKYRKLSGEAQNQPDLKVYKAQTIHLLDVLRSDASEELKNQALRAVIDKIVYDKADKRIDIFYSNYIL